MGKARKSQNNNNYYSKKLNSNSLMNCYEIAPQRVQQFLKAEIDFVLTNISSSDHALELGCGYGRVAKRISEKAGKITGIDISTDNIQLANEYVQFSQKCEFLVMDARKLEFPNDCFDITICVQNGISAFKLDPIELLKESIRVTKNNGIILFSSYSEKFWAHRLEWFQIQSDHNLIGEIDKDLTKDGTIVCKDGFRAITYSGEDFLELTSKFNVEPEIIEVDDSSVFCRMKVRKSNP
jgi:2-polyprenyl-6-hydroxyphenyl methylase/3-demethylubiquinone-9 3-methyltransferase